tara:strand:+ start:247 stop:477 length:231 start_codon:yes stop_codon:yes gene_type:complete
MAKKQKAKASETKAKTEDKSRAHIRENLRRVHSFLRKDFRIVEESELNSEEVFKELFPEDKTVQLYKLRAIYEIQK